MTRETKADLEGRINVIEGDLHRERERRQRAECEVARLRGMAEAYEDVLLKAGLINPPKEIVSADLPHLQRDMPDFAEVADSCPTLRRY